MFDPDDTPRCRLYLITPPRLDPASFADVLGAALDAGDVACVQLCLAEADDAALRRAAEVLIPVCQARDAAFLVDGNSAVAAAVGADGVHVADARKVAMARQLLRPGAIIGASCGGSRHAAMSAGEAGVDYVSFGAIHPSPTKPDAAIVDPDIVGWWSGLMEIPCVAVGGVNAANCAPLVAQGADFLAVCSAVWDDPVGPAAAVAALNAAVESAQAS